MSYRFLAAGLITLTAACTPAADETNTAAGPVEPAYIVDTLESAVNGPWRSEAERARDSNRNPAETLAFFEVEPSDTVIEIWPGGGWYSNILAPYLASGDGKLVAAHWNATRANGDRRLRIETIIDEYMSLYENDPDLYGTVELSVFPDAVAGLAAPESADAVLTFRNVHNWMARDYAADFFDQAYAALKPGGVLGVVEHRLPSSLEQDPRAASGYVHEDFVKSLAAASGFEFVEASEINANPADTADHPFGVWTLPPSSRTEDRDGNTVEGFDPARYLAIGESDRMTLKFRKPGGEVVGIENAGETSGDSAN